MTADRKTPSGATSQVKSWEAHGEVSDEVSEEKVNQQRYFYLLFL